MVQRRGVHELVAHELALARERIEEREDRQQSAGKEGHNAHGLKHEHLDAVNFVGCSRIPAKESDDLEENLCTFWYLTRRKKL